MLIVDDMWLIAVMRSRLPEMGPKLVSVITQVSAIEGCPAGFHCIYLGYVYSHADRSLMNT